MATKHEKLSKTSELCKWTYFWFYSSQMISGNLKGSCFRYVFSTGGLPDYLLHNKCTSYGAFLLCKDHFQYSSSLLVSVHCIMYFVISTAIIHFCQHTLSLIIAGERWEDNKKLPDFSLVESKSFSHSYFAPGTGTSSTEGRRGVGGGGGKHIAIQMGVGSGPSKHLEPEGKWDDLIHMQVLCC